VQTRSSHGGKVFPWVVNTSGMEPGELQDRYIEAIIRSVLEKYRVHQVLGSRRRADRLIGPGVPACGNSGAVGNRGRHYHHDRAGKLVTISDFFDGHVRERH